MNYRHNSGFTIIELMIVIVILGILITIALPNFFNSTERARISSMKSNMHTLQIVVETYGANFDGNYPSDLNSLLIESKNGKYDKLLFNPFNNVTADINNKDVAFVYTDLEFQDLNPDTIISQYEGKIGYYSLKGEGGVIPSYGIYGHQRNGNIITSKGKVFFLSNS